MKPNLRFVFTPYINQLVWELFTIPLLIILLRVDGVHFTANTGNWLFAKIFGVKIFLTLHDVSFFKPVSVSPKPSSMKQLIGYHYRRLIVPGAIRQADKIITVSDFAANDIALEMNIVKENISIVHNSISSDFSLRQPTKAKGPLILIVSGRSPQKNLQWSVDVLGNVLMQRENWSGIVVGSSANTNSNKIQFLEQLGRKDLIALYDQAAVLLMPSLYESFALPILEAMSRRTIVVASSIGGCKEVAGGWALHFDPRNRSDLEARLKEAIDLFECGSTRLTEGAAQHALKFTAREQARKTLDLYLLEEWKCQHTA